MPGEVVDLVGNVANGKNDTGVDWGRQAVPAVGQQKVRKVLVPRC